MCPSQHSIKGLARIRPAAATHFLAGDTSYNEKLMLAGKVDGVSPHEQVYLPTHDPESAARLANRSVVGKAQRTAA
jgi:hypothetical protein